MFDRVPDHVAARGRRASWTVATLLALLGDQFVARAEPIQSLAWDFATGGGGWVATNTFLTNPPPQTPRWTWSGAARTWSVDSAPVQSPAYRSGNYLTSPLIRLAPEAPADKFTFTLAHRFKLPADGIVRPGYRIPVGAGQLTYSLDGDVFLPLPASVWATSGSLPASVAAVVQAPGWAVPQFTPGAGPVVSLPPLVDGGAAFTGLSPGFSSGWFVASQAFEVDLPATTTTIQFRLTNMNLGQKCGLDAGWDVRFAQVDLILAPEPEAGVTAAVGTLLLAAAWIGRRRLQSGATACRRSPAGFEAEREAVHEHAAAGVDRGMDGIERAQTLVVELSTGRRQTAEPEGGIAGPERQPIEHVVHRRGPDLPDERPAGDGPGVREHECVLEGIAGIGVRGGLHGAIPEDARLAEPFDAKRSAESDEDRVATDLQSVKIVVRRRGIA